MAHSPFPLLGILGGGQLGRMTALAALRMGIGIRTLSPKPAGPVDPLGEPRVGDWTDPDVLHAFADGCTAVTVESEWAPAEHLQPVLPTGVPVYPTPDTLALIRHKGIQKQTMLDAGLPVPAFARCPTRDEGVAAAERLGYPVVLKRYRGSYDGYGNGIARNADDVAALWPDLSDDDGLLVEAWVDFDQELSVLVARRPGGEHVVYPVAYTEQRDHRCHAVVVPADVDSATARSARDIAVSVARAFGVVGMLGVELFLDREGHVLLNEIAPRPHNTGHYTIEGSHTSQFENHVRAVLDLPLGDPGLRAPCAVMVNVLGHRDGAPSAEHLAASLSIDRAGVHVYGKDSVRPRRKMGHVTMTGTDPVETRRLAEQAAAALIL